MIDILALNDIVNEVDVIVMPGKLQKTTTQLILVTGKYLPENSYWAIFPSIYENCSDENLAVFTIVVANLNTVMRTVPITQIHELTAKCNSLNAQQALNSLKQQGYLKEVGANYFINHSGLIISTLPPTPSKPVKLSDNIMAIQPTSLPCEPPNRPFKIIPFKTH